MISKSLIVGMGLAGVGLGLAGSFAPAEAGPYACSASTTIGSCTASTTFTATQTEWSNISFIVHLFDTSTYAPMTGMQLVVSGSINFGNNSTITNTSASAQSFTYNETTSFSFASTNSALQTALATLIPPPIATDSQSVTALGSGATFTLSTAPGAAFTSSLNGPIVDFEHAGGGVSTISANTLTGQNVVGGGGNVVTSVTTLASLTISYIYTYGTPTNVPEPLSVAVLGSGLLGLGLLRRRRNNKV